MFSYINCEQCLENQVQTLYWVALLHMWEIVHVRCVLTFWKYSVWLQWAGHGVKSKQCFVYSTPKIMDMATNLTGMMTVFAMILVLCDISAISVKEWKAINRRAEMRIKQLHCMHNDPTGLSYYERHQHAHSLAVNSPNNDLLQSHMNSIGHYVYVVLGSWQGKIHLMSGLAVHV